MSEKSAELRTFEITYGCDVEGCCGEMKTTGQVMLCHPPMFEHRCTICGTHRTMSRSYPAIEHRYMVEK